MIYAALFHNGFLQITHQINVEKMNLSYVPTVSMQQWGAGVNTKQKWRISDWWMLKHIASSAGVKKHVKVWLA